MKKFKAWLIRGLGGLTREQALRERVEEDRKENIFQVDTYHPVKIRETVMVRLNPAGDGGISKHAKSQLAFSLAHHLLDRDLIHFHVEPEPTIRDKDHYIEVDVAEMAALVGDLTVLVKDGD